MFLKLVEVNQRMNLDIEGIKKDNEKLSKALWQSLDTQEEMKKEIESLKEKVERLERGRIPTPP